MGEELTKRELPTNVLRWVPKSMLQANELKLQQQWDIFLYIAGTDTIHKFYHEWRDVPTIYL